MEVTFGFSSSMCNDLDICRNMLESISRNAVIEIALSELRKKLEEDKDILGTERKERNRNCS
jgi:hypothetical protein